VWSPCRPQSGIAVAPQQRARMSANIRAEGTDDQKDLTVFAGVQCTSPAEEKMMKPGRAGRASFQEHDVLLRGPQPVLSQRHHRSFSFETSQSSNFSASWGSSTSETRRGAWPLQPRLQPVCPKAPENAGFVTLRITPQHFSPLGTTFRDVQVGFHSNSFVVRAVDYEGYAWTASSSSLPGGLVVDCCKFKIDPTGKDVTIHLCKADRDPKWWSVTCLELKRPYSQHERPPFPRQDKASQPRSQKPSSIATLQLHRVL
ncbi:unnamed protein product, partial [Symbiodinium microadriaticum]